MAQDKGAQADPVTKGGRNFVNTSMIEMILHGHDCVFGCVIKCKSKKIRFLPSLCRNIETVSHCAMGVALLSCPTLCHATNQPSAITSARPLSVI